MDISDIANKADIVGGVISEIACGYYNTGTYSSSGYSITHGLSTTPDIVLLTAHTYPQLFYVSSVSSTTIKVYAYQVTSTSYAPIFSWMAIVLAS